MATLERGQPAPDFETLNQENQKVGLSDFRGRRVVLYFYPKDNTPGCTTQACLFRDHHPEFENLEATVLGISPDGVSSHQKFRTEHQLPFQLLVDPDHQIADLYGAWGEKSMYGRKYMGVIRSLFVVDEGGLIVDAHYRVSPKKSVPGALRTLGDL